MLRHITAVFHRPRHGSPPSASFPRLARRRAPRRTLAPLLLLVALAAPAQEAKAQWAVIDPAHIVKSIANGRQMVGQLRTQGNQLLAFQNNLRKLTSYNLRDVTGFVSAVDQTLVSASNVAYSSASLAGDFDAFYRGGDPSATGRTADAFVTDELDSALGTLRSIREHAVQIRAARRDLDAFQQQIRGATTIQEIAEVQGSVQTYGVQESQLLRQASLLQIDQAARTQAASAARRSYAVAAGRSALARSTAGAAGMRGTDYNTGSLF